MKRHYSLLVAALPIMANAFADEYVITSWEKSKLATDTQISADKVLIGGKNVSASQQVRVNPYDSLVLVNTATQKTSTYVNTSDKTRVVSVKDMVKRRSFNVVISMISETFAPKKAEKPQFKLIGAGSRSEITQSTVDPEHMKIYNTLLNYVDKNNAGHELKHNDLKFFTDTIDGIVKFVVENHNSKKSYIVNVLVRDPATDKLDMAITFPEHTSSPAVVVGPYTRIELDGVGYAVQEGNPLEFLLVVSTKPYDPNYLSLLMNAEHIKPTREGTNKDIVCVSAEK